MPTSRKAISMSEFIFQPSADKVTEMLKKGCKCLFRSRNAFFPPLSWYSELAGPVLFKPFQNIHIWTKSQSGRFHPESFIFQRPQKTQRFRMENVTWFNSRKSCLFYYNAFAYKYLFTSKVLTCLVSKEKLKKKCTSIKGRNSRKCKIFQNYFSSAFQKKILAYFKSSIARMIHRI